MATTNELFSCSYSCPTPNKQRTYLFSLFSNSPIVASSNYTCKSIDSTEQKASKSQSYRFKWAKNKQICLGIIRFSYETTQVPINQRKCNYIGGYWAVNIITALLTCSFISKNSLESINPSLKKKHKSWHEHRHPWARTSSTIFIHLVEQMSSSNRTRSDECHLCKMWTPNMCMLISCLVRRRDNTIQFCKRLSDLSLFLIMFMIMAPVRRRIPSLNPRETS